MTSFPVITIYTVEAFARAFGDDEARARDYLDAGTSAGVLTRITIDGTPAWLPIENGTSS